MIPEFSDSEAFQSLLESVTDRSVRPWQYTLVITSRQGRIAVQMGLNPYCSWPIHGCSYMMVDYPPKLEE